MQSYSLSHVQDSVLLHDLASFAAHDRATTVIEAATHRKKSEVEELVAGRFSPQAPMPRVRLLTPIASPRLEHAPGHVGSPTTLDVFDQHAPGPTEDSDPRPDGPERKHAPGHVEGPQLNQAPERFLLQLLIDRDTRDKLQRAVALLSHSVPDGSVAQVLKRALDALITQVEKRKLGSGAVRPRDRVDRRSEAVRT